MMGAMLLRTPVGFGLAGLDPPAYEARPDTVTVAAGVGVTAGSAA